MSKKTVGEVLDIALKRAERRGCEPATLKTYRYNIESFWRPALGSKKVSKLRPEDLERVYDKMVRRGLAGSTIRKAHATMSVALKHAERREWVRTNPCRLAQLPKSLPLPKDWVTTEQLAAFLDIAERRDPTIADYARIIAGTGCRPGEACALRQSDLATDLTLTIERALDVCQGKARVKLPKTNRPRSFAVDPVTAEIIRHRETPYLFGGDEPERTDLMSKRFRRCAKRAKVSFTPRNLRAYHATQLIAMGVDIETVKARLGHATSSTTASYYLTNVPANDLKATIAIASVIPCRKSER